MSDFRELQAKLKKIDESYFSRLAAAADDMALYNKRMSDDELIALINTELGEQAAEYIRDKLASGEPIEEDLFVDDDLHTRIETALREIDPKLRSSGYKPGVDDGLIDVLVSDPITGEDRTMVYSKQSDSILRSGEQEERNSFNSWMDQNPFESINEDAATRTWLGIDNVRIMPPTEKHRPAIWEGILGTVNALDDNGNEKYFDYDYEGAKAHANIANKANLRLFRYKKRYHRAWGGDGPSNNQWVLWAEKAPKGVSGSDLDEGAEDKWPGTYEDVGAWEGQSVKITGGDYQGETGKVIDAKQERMETGSAMNVFTVKLYSGATPLSNLRHGGSTVILYLDEWSDDQLELQYDPTHRPDGRYDPELEEDSFRHEEDSINDQIRSLLNQGKKVISKAAGAVGEVIDIDDRGLSTIQHPPETRRGRSVANFNSFDNIEIVGNIDHYDIIQHWPGLDDDDDGIDEDVINWMKRFDKLSTPANEDAMDERGKMCPVCIGQRREGYGNDCPNCGGEGYVDEAVVEVPAGLRGEDQENLEQGGATSRDAERFLADLGPDDSVDTNVVDPETGDLLDWPTKDTQRAQDDEEMQQQMDREEEEDSIFRTPYIPGGSSKSDAGGVQSFDGMDRAMEDLGNLRFDKEITDFYDITWKNIEDLVDNPETYYDGDYDISWDMPIAIKRTDGQKFTDEDHNNFRRLTSLFRAATYNISASYVGLSDNGTVARFVPSFH